MVEADSEITDPSIRGLRITDFITGHLFAPRSSEPNPKFAGRRAGSGAADVYAFMLIFWKRQASHRFPDSTISRPDDSPMLFSGSKGYFMSDLELTGFDRC
jgi:hypothetical protein